MNVVMLRHQLRSELSSEIDEPYIRDLVRDLHRVNARIYWMDLLITAAIGWTAFVFAVAAPLFSFRMFAWEAVAVFSLYRALCFMHEISHQSQRTLPGFEFVWNLLVGYPILMPSFMYCGVHQNHHKLSTYGTEQDPEYLPFARSRRLTILFALESVLIPLFLLVRFLVLGPVSLLSKRFGEQLVIYASSLAMNPRYRRQPTPFLVSKVRRHSAGILGLWGGAMVAAIVGWLPLRTFLVWLMVCSMISFVNIIRTLGAHAYESSGEPLDRLGQLLDSIDTPGRFWTELWAPVGLRYHALHHYFPGIPYHNLREAYRRIAASITVGASYQKVTSPSLQHSLRTLYEKAGCKWN